MFVAGAVLIFDAAQSAIESTSVYRASEEVVGTVTSVTRHLDHCKLNTELHICTVFDAAVEFKTRDDTPHTGVVSVKNIGWDCQDCWFKVEKDEKLNLLFDSNNPSALRMNSFRELWGQTAASVGILVLLVLFVVWSKKRQAVRIANRQPE